MGNSRKTYIVANWKMNFTPGEASIYLHKLSERVKGARDLQVVLCPSLVSLQPLSLQVSRRQFKLAAQNFYWRDFGAYTGEVAIAQLRGFVDYALVGHSERRHIFCETDKDIREKVAAAVRNDITPILCIGETSDERLMGETDVVIYDQLLGGLSEISKEDIDKVIVAYEPVWAISSTKNARSAAPEEIEDAIKRIRTHISKLYGKNIAEEISVLYGGSVNPSSAAAYLNVEGVDGLLVGGASLIADSFCDIVEIAKGVEK
ncbi:MAG: triose-phosphate isomerase [Candidatus Nomurabacteria bacterium]|jgi:triosephosphate isomerase|nr:triose-phosphate isomerase [Candidatus Nomurabacteria bacterium]